MGFGIYTGGTTGLTDGTLVSASNKLTFPSITTVLDAHIRCGEDEYSAQIDFNDIPLELEISFNAGGVWYGIGNAPFYAATSQGPGNSDVWDVNYPIKLRQVAVPVTADDTFTTDGTVSACTALSTPTLTATPGDTEIDLSWTNVANEDGYTLDRSTASDFSANLVSVSKGAGVTTHTATGLTNGVTYYFRVKAEGSGRYSDSGYGTDDATPAGAPTTDTFYANAGGDGAVRTFGSGGGWFATARGAATGHDAYGGNTGHYSAYVDPPNGLISRGFYPFDTSALPDGATITAASLFVYSYVTPGTGGGGSTDNKSVCVVESTQASPTALTTADYDQVGSTLLADRIPFSSFPSAGYQEIPLNATGLAAISKTGYTKLALIAGYDFDNVAPTTDWCGFASKFSDETGTSMDPYLKVTYTV